MVPTPFPYKEDRFNYVRIVKIIVNLYFLLLVVYLTYLIHTQGRKEAIDIYKNIRDMSYKVVGVSFIALGVFMALGRKTNSNKEEIQKLIPLAVISLILLTFSYGMADTLYRLLKSFNLL